MNVFSISWHRGRCPASYHVSLQAPEKLILISPFASLRDLAQRKFWFYPSPLLVDNAFNNIALLAAYSGPIFIIHGDKDMIISQKSALKLYENLKTTQKEFVSLEGFGHNNLFSSPIPFEVIKDALEEAN